MVVGLTISEGKFFPKKLGILGMDLHSVGIPSFRRLKFPRNSFGILFCRTPKQSEFRIPNQKTGFGISFRAMRLRISRNSVFPNINKMDSISGNYLQTCNLSYWISIGPRLIVIGFCIPFIHRYIFHRKMGKKRAGQGYGKKEGRVGG